MQWDSSNGQAGFSINPKTWLPVSSTYISVNVQSELQDKNSLLVWYRKLIELRRTNDALHHGRVTLIDSRNPDVLAYTRTGKDGAGVLVALNMSSSPKTLALSGIPGVGTLRGLNTLLSNPSVPKIEASHIVLPPFGVWLASYPVPR
jgi:alpha-glucosidase